MIEKSFTTPTGAEALFHAVSRAEATAPLDALMVHVNSYASEATFLAGAGIVWASVIRVPTTDVAGSLAGHIEAWLITDQSSPLSGGAIVSDKSETLGAVQDRAWAAIKAAREQAENGTFMYDGGSYQADKARIPGAVQLATLSKAAGLPFSETWTLTDNSTRTLNADHVIGLGIALGQYVSGIYAIGRSLRTQIYAATTIDEVNAIRWPT